MKITPGLDILTIDCEDFFALPAFSKLNPKFDWDIMINRQIDTLLDILEKSASTKATFFIVGELAERNPEIVRKIERNGHHIGSHCYHHVFIDKLTNGEFEQQLLESKRILESIIQKPINCFRAPYWSNLKDKKVYWAILERNKISIDSSIFPISKFLYGDPKSKRYINKINRNIVEFPPSTIRFLGINIPFSGGVYFRILPFFLIKAIIRQLHKRGYPVTMYFHPWEFDPGLKRIRGITTFYKFILYYNKKNALIKFQRLINEWNFTSIENYMKNIKE